MHDEPAAGCFSGFLRRARRREPQRPGSAPAPSSEPSLKAPPPDFTRFDGRFEKADSKEPPPYSPDTSNVYDPEVLDTIEACLAELDPKLREVSLSIHGHPELAFQEKFAHDVLTKFMASHGFNVTPQYLGLDTAWRAEFSHGTGGRTLGVNSEMDALPGIGHACGHNLIAMAGVGVALAVKAALVKHDVPGKVVLLGTPAEEGGGGKDILLRRGGYKDMDVCVMCHPSAGNEQSIKMGSTLAMQSIEVEYFGRAAHAGAAPWEGVNSLDAAFVAYSSISALRQQIKPDHRIHGTVSGKDWAANIIPDYAKMTWIVRAPTAGEVAILRERVANCLKAASLATGCEHKMSVNRPYLELRQNGVLAKDLATVSQRRYGVPTQVVAPTTTASTDFGNVCYALPSLHPSFSIPTEDNAGNHNPGFTRAAATPAAHDATMVVVKSLAHTGYRALCDDEFFLKAKREFEANKPELPEDEHMLSLWRALCP